jgi:hypothetical protein
VDSKKSTSGYIFTLAGGAISWESFKQTITASSTMQDEYIVCYEAIEQAIWLMSTHASVLVDSVGPPSAEVCRTAASFP